MFKRFAIGLLLTLAIPALTYAQYGKISGKITDRETKEPLVGATVLLEGTTLGASSDINGNYVILNVPAGTYNVKASYIGYHPLTIAGLSVLAGLTRDLPIQLSSTAVQVSSVEIIAQRPLIEKTATNAIRIVGTQEIQNLPVRGAQAYFTLQPGVVLQNNAVYIRGSRADEVGYQLEGADVKNIVGSNIPGAGTGGPTGNAGSTGGYLPYVTTIPEALQEISVQAGGYSAEFGGSNSGIVQQTFKTGGSKWNFTAQGETDDFGNYPGKKFADTYSYGYSDYILTLGGPVFSDNIKLFLAGENNFFRDSYNGGPLFWSGANFGYLYDTGLRGGTRGDSALVAWNSGNLPVGMNNRYTLNGTMLFDYKPVQFRLSGAFSAGRYQNTADLYDIFDLARVPLSQTDNLLLNGKLSYFLSANTFFEVNLNYLDYRQLTTDPTYGTNLLAYSDSLAAAANGWQFVTRTAGPNPYDFAGFPFQRPGAVLTGLSKDHNGYLGGSVDLTSQIGNHEVKVGGSYEYWTIRHYGLGTAIFSQMINQPDIARDPTALALLLREQAVANWGYDEFGAPYNGSGANAPKHPYFAAGYIEDRIEFSDLVINAGLRLDNMFMDSWDFPNLENPTYNDVTFTVDPLASRVFTYLEPRLGLSFPVTDQTVFHLQYGKFVQAPELDQLYASQGTIAQFFSGQFYFIGGDVALNVGPVRTTQYEVGLSQQFTDFAAFDVTGFYKDVAGQLVDTKIFTLPQSQARDYHTFQNGDFETVMGLEFSLRVRRVNRLEAMLNYTLQDARGTNSFANGAEALQEVAGIPITMVTPLTYDQTHRGSLMLDYRFAKGDGGPILEQLGLNLLFTFNSGHPFTLATGSAGQTGVEAGAILTDGDARGRFPLEPVNNSITPWVYSLDARLDKNFDLPGGISLDIYIYAQNLLNTQNVINVYYRTGNAYSDGYLTSSLGAKAIQNGGAMFIPLYQVINLENNQNQRGNEFDLGNGFDNFGTPRQIRVGARLEF